MHWGQEALVFVARDHKRLFQLAAFHGGLRDPKMTELSTSLLRGARSYIFLELKKNRETSIAVCLSCVLRVTPATFVRS